MAYASWRQIEADRAREADVQRILRTPSHRTAMAGIKPAARFAYADTIIDASIARATGGAS